MSVVLSDGTQQTHNDALQVPGHGRFEGLDQVLEGREVREDRVIEGNPSPPPSPLLDVLLGLEKNKEKSLERNETEQEVERRQSTLSIWPP